MTQPEMQPCLWLGQGFMTQGPEGGFCFHFCVIKLSHEFPEGVSILVWTHDCDVILKS